MSRVRRPGPVEDSGSTNTSALHVVGAAIVEDRHCLVAQRGPGMSLAGHWEFPGGKVEPRESPQSALVREIREELGLEIEVGSWLGRGEAIVDGREIVLDVYYSNIVHGEPHPKEHAQARWIDSTQIAGLEWADADRPVLPFLGRALDRGISDRPLPEPVPVVSVDWAKHERGRAVYTACPKSGGWLIERPTLPRGGWSFSQVLSLAERIAEPFGGSSLVAIDAVLGVPVGYGSLTGQEDFPAVMHWLEQHGAFAKSIRDPDRWRAEAPFFGVNSGEGGLTRYVERAGGRAVLYRELERVIGAKTVFATSGIPGTVGSGSVALWRDILAARRSGERDFRIWPFEIELEEVLSSGCPVIAESYPRACYAVALAPTLPARPAFLAKTNRGERINRLEDLSGASWVRDQALDVRGLEWAQKTEDDFDALMQAAALVRMIDSEIPLSSNLVDPAWEGGILGTGGLMLREPRLPRSRPSRSRKPRADVAGRTDSLMTCPIEGCPKVFQSGRLGWNAHVGSVRMHPDWEPSLVSAEHRKSAFREQFSDWFEG